MLTEPDWGECFARGRQQGDAIIQIQSSSTIHSRDTGNNCETTWDSGGERQEPWIHEFIIMLFISGPDHSTSFYIAV